MNEWKLKTVGESMAIFWDLTKTKIDRENVT
jgi:hypothetical protein